MEVLVKQNNYLLWFASCVSRVIALDKTTSSKAETVKEMTFKQKEEKTQAQNTRTTTELVVQMLPGFLAKKQVNFYAQHLSTVLTCFFQMLSV